VALLRFADKKLGLSELEGSNTERLWVPKYELMLPEFIQSSV